MELKIKNLSYGYEKKLLFQDVSFSLKNGDILTILGINGAGKTTLVKCILQFIHNYQGNITIDGVPLKNLTIRERAKWIGYVTSNDISNYDITVFDYISLGLATKMDYLSCPSNEQYCYIQEVCKKYYFHDFLGRKIQSLSQGERQMVSVLRVIVQNPDIIVFDEPTAALDLKNQKDLIELMITMKNQGKIVIQISHNPNHALQLGGKALLLFPGKTTYGTVEDIINGESLSKLYGTEILIEEIKGKKFILA